MDKDKTDKYDVIEIESSRMCAGTCGTKLRYGSMAVRIEGKVYCIQCAFKIAALGQP